MNIHIEDPVSTKAVRRELTNQTSKVRLQLLNFRLLKEMLRYVIDGVTTIKPGYQTTGNARVIWPDRVVLHAVPNIRKSLRSENTQGNLQSRMPGSKSESRERFCDGLVSNVVVFSWSHGLITTKE
jgi:hypothetical protein